MKHWRFFFPAAGCGLWMGCGRPSPDSVVAGAIWLSHTK
jgi:hypothetical protein